MFLKNQFKYARILNLKLTKVTLTALYKIQGVPKVIRIFFERLYLSQFFECCLFLLKVQLMGFPKLA